jgi:hypothetical protein
LCLVLELLLLSLLLLLLRSRFCFLVFLAFLDFFFFFASCVVGLYPTICEALVGTGHGMGV